MKCLDADTVLAFLDGGLKVGGVALVESHVAGCAHCAAVVTEAARRQSPRTDPDSASPLVRLRRGDKVGRYVILDLIGRGGMGDVYAAYDPSLDRKIALKLLRRRALDDADATDARARLLREAKAIARLSHPNVVVVHDAGEIDGRVFLAMGFVEGQTLASWLAAAPRAPKQIRDLFASAGRGLAAAHAAGLVHRDFKPQNVMVGRDGSVQVTDFGLAVDLGEAPDRATVGDLLGPGPSFLETPALTKTGALVGTPLYMAPEQLLRRRADAHTDQFSFCVSLYTALSGEHPFPTTSFAELKDAVTTGRVRETNPGRISARWRAALLRGLQADPARRFPSMEALLRELEYDPRRRRRLVAAASAIVALTVAASWATTRVRDATSGAARFCNAGPARLAGTWESSDQVGQRAAVRGAFLATSPVLAGGIWGRLVRVLDAYAGGWVAEYRDACERTHVHRDQTSEVLDLRMACLDSRLESLRSLTEILARADEAAVTQSVQAAYALPPLDRCRDVAALRAAMPPPEDRSVRARVDALQSEVARVAALRDTGRWPEARQRGARLIDAARATGYEPLIAHALAAVCQFQGNAGEIADSTKTCEQAALTAIAAHEDELAAYTAVTLADVYGYGLVRFDESDRWLAWAQTILKRLGGGHDRLAGWLTHARGDLYDARGDPAAARAELEHALSLKTRALPPDHPEIAFTQSSLANELNELGESRLALTHSEAALRILTSVYGADNVHVAMTVSNQSEILEDLGRHADALAAETRALEVMRARLSPDHSWLAYPMTAMGRTLISSDRAEEAVSVLERALAIRLKGDPRPQPIAEVRFALARALSEAHRDRARSLGLARAALATYREMPGLARQKLQVEAWLAAHGLVRPSK